LWLWSIIEGPEGTENENSANVRTGRGSVGILFFLMGTYNENSENVRTGRGSVGILFFLMGIENENVGTD